jgi:von Willebrand factor type A domain
VDVRFLTPLAALFALTALLPLAVFLDRQRRGRAIRSMLGLAEPSPASRLPLVLALAALPGLLALAAAQPVVEESRSRPERTDAEAFVVLDISRSMLAAAHTEAPTRLERARRVAVALRDDLPEVPIGLASLTDRVLPHVFPTTDRRVFVEAVEESVGIERPPATNFYLTHATTLEALTALPTRNYFSARARKRLLVVLTDGETRSVGRALAQAFQRRPRIETILVHLWDARERIYATGVAEGGYRPLPGSSAALERVAALIGGRVFSEDDAGEVGAAAHEIVGAGKTRQRQLEGERLALMPYVTLAAALPLGFLLLRRNFL